MENLSGDEHIAGMDGTTAPKHEGDIERERRLEWETKCIAEAQADIDAGRVMPWERVREWMQSIGTENELPTPRWQP